MNDQAARAASGRTALITGVRGQDGFYLARHLFQRGYAVVGTTHRREAAGPMTCDGHTLEVVHLDLRDGEQIAELVRRLEPDEFYNVAARASSAELFDDPLLTADVNGTAVMRMLEAIRLHSPQCRFCQAGSSEVFAGAASSPQDEQTPFAPTNAYGAAKAFAHHIVAAYRSAHGLFACSAILFPHESPRRSPHFVMRKIVSAAVRIAAGKQQLLELGDLGAVRDWGYAPDYVEAMHRMTQGAEARDFVLASGEGHSVREVCEIAFAHVGLDYEKHVRVDTQLKRAPDPVARVGNPARARAARVLTRSFEFADMVRYLVDADRATLAGEPFANRG